MEVKLQKKLRGGKEPFYLDVSFEIAKGKILAIMGPSGAGKTSILKMIAGLLSPDQGFVKVSNSIWYQDQPRTNLKPQERSIGYVFQDYALFPNMSVRENLKYALPSQKSQTIVDDILEQIHIENLADQKPISLSGGQQQRVALARALIRRPEVMLLDEPFAALDEEMRGSLQRTLIELHRLYQTTVLLVSHNTVEVARLADKVIQIQNGQITRQGLPSEVLNHAASTSLLQGEVLSVQNGQITLIIQNSLSTIRVSETNSSYRVGDILHVSAEQVQIRKKE